MTQPSDRTPVQPGERAPDFAVAAVHEDRTIASGDFRGRTPVLLGLFPGLYCPFGRRALARLAAAALPLDRLGIATLAIVGTEPDNARRYFPSPPTGMLIGADPALATHRAYGVPRPEPTPDLLAQVAAVRINPTGELPEPLPLAQASAALAALDGFQPTPTDRRESKANGTQLQGQFLIDRTGVVRWANIECGREGFAGLGKFPAQEELLTAARLVLGRGD